MFTGKSCMCRGLSIYKESELDAGMCRNQHKILYTGGILIVQFFLYCQYTGRGAGACLLLYMSTFKTPNRFLSTVYRWYRFSCSKIITSSSPNAWNKTRKTNYSQYTTKKPISSNKLRNNYYHFSTGTTEELITFLTQRENKNQLKANNYYRLSCKFACFWNLNYPIACFDKTNISIHTRIVAEISPQLPLVVLKDGGWCESKTGQVPNNSIYFTNILSNMFGEGNVYQNFIFLRSLRQEITQKSCWFDQHSFINVVSKDSLKVFCFFFVKTNIFCSELSLRGSLKEYLRFVKVFYMHYVLCIFVEVPNFLSGKLVY